MREAVIVSAKRTPIGEYFGVFKDLTAVDLGVHALKAAIEAAGIDANQIEEVVGGHIYQAGCKGNTARQVALGSGCSVETVASTINQQCPSSLRAVEIVAQNIMLGKIDIGAAVGYESMTNVPYLLPKVRSGLKMGDSSILDGLLNDALIDAFNDYHMGVTAETLAEEYEISREEQDELAVISHQRACDSIKNGVFIQEIAPVKVKTKRETKMIDKDEHPNPTTNIDTLSKLRPAFKKDGTVTAGNASSLNDGGAAVILMSKEKAIELGLKPLARIVASASAAVDPKKMGIGVVPAVHKALQFAGLQMKNIDYWELNEAFAAQFLAVNRELNIPMEQVNAYGSRLSLGHAVGCTGVRLLTTLIYEMQRRGSKYGCASLCAGGGPAAALIVEAL